MGAGMTARPERWRLAGWLGGVPAAEWEACAGLGYQRMLRVCRFGSEDAAGPAGEDASAPTRSQGAK